MQRELVERAAKGDVEAFDVLVRRSSDRLYAIAYRVLRDQYLAEDALQQTLVTVWKELPRLRDPDRFDAWTYRLVVRASVAEARRRQHGGSAVAVLPNDTEMAPAADGYRAVADRDELERAFRRISPEQRAVLVLQHYGDMSLAEIAETLEIPPGTVASRIHYATRALRAALEADERNAALAGKEHAR